MASQQSNVFEFEEKEDYETHKEHRYISPLNSFDSVLTPSELDEFSALSPPTLFGGYLPSATTNPAKMASSLKMRSLSSTLLANRNEEPLQHSALSSDVPSRTTQSNFDQADQNGFLWEVCSQKHSIVDEVHENEPI